MTVDSQSLQDVYDAAVGDSAGLTQGAESVTQSDSRLPHSQTAAPPRTLDVVVEEEEESGHMQRGPSVPAVPRPRRKSPLLQEPQEHLDGTRASGEKGKTISRTKSKPAPSQSHQVDTDPTFLTALASKKGKKTAEDNFDREFNKLRISKPDIHREEEEQAWEILGDFDTEARNIRGNFMVVIDLEVFRRNSGHGNTSVARRTYDGRPNFKKFKKVHVSNVYCGSSFEHLIRHPLRRHVLLLSSWPGGKTIMAWAQVCLRGFLDPQPPLLYDRLLEG